MQTVLFILKKVLVQQPVGQLQQAEEQYLQQIIIQIPWGHNILIFTKAKDINEALFHINQTKRK